MAIAKVSLAATAVVDPVIGLTNLVLAAGSVAATPVLLPRTQVYLTGCSVDGHGDVRQKNIFTIAAAASRIAASEVEPIDDVRSTAAYRQMVTGELVRRFVLQVLT